VRAAVKWLTFLSNQFTAALAEKQVSILETTPGLHNADVVGRKTLLSYCNISESEP
jgi:hypothetical protein